MRIKFYISNALIIGMILISGSICPAITTKITTQSSSSEFEKGKTDKVVITSQGTIELSRDSDILVEDLEDAWVINSIVATGGTVFLGTSPNGAVYRYRLGDVQKIYPNNKNTDTAEEDSYLTNEHVFAMAVDISGRLLVGLSGDNCALMRYEKAELKKIFEPEDATYIFAVKVDRTGRIFLATGPEGKIYQLDSFGKNADVLYQVKDKNILSLELDEKGSLYAGTDETGLVYKIDIDSGKAKVLFDSNQPEITALSYVEGEGLYATSTSAEISQVKKPMPKAEPLPGRPDVNKKDPDQQGEGGLKLNIPNSAKKDEGNGNGNERMPRKPVQPEEMSHVYKITEEGFVTEVFSEVSVMFALAKQNSDLLLGTGNSGKVYLIDSAAEKIRKIFEDEQATQVTSLFTAGDTAYAGTANPAKLISLGSQLSHQGSYLSDLVDAGQPAVWGKLQINADIPKGTKVLMSCRSGNVNDVNHPSFSDWTEPVLVTEPVEMDCPLGRYSQYKLVLKSPDGKKTPNIREVAVASSVANLTPKVEEVNTERQKQGLFEIAYNASDRNEDELTYKIEFRQTAWTNWIELEDDYAKSSFSWDSKTVEDGRYEIRVTADDYKSNSPQTSLKNSRISEPFVVDNTAPVIEGGPAAVSDSTVVIELRVVDQFSVIKKVDYTIDSDDNWIGSIPTDKVYDTLSEDFNIVINDLEEGEHIVSVRVSDGVDNVTYKSYKVNIKK